MSKEPDANPYAAPKSVFDEMEVEQDEHSGPKLASRWSRLGATVIDHLIVIGPLVLAFAYSSYRSNSPLDLTNSSSYDLGVTLAGLFALAVLVVNVFLLHYSGQTLGKKVVGIRIARSDGYSYASWWRIVGLRFLPVYAASRWIPVVGPAVWGLEALTIFGRDRRCIHDYLADTIVITEGGAAAPADAGVIAAQEDLPVELDNEPLVVVATVDGPVEAAFAQGLLEEQQIPSRLDFEPLRSHDPVLGASSGGAKLMVASEHVDAAVDILAQGLEDADGAQFEYDWGEEGSDDE